jgi:hypothetical protein
MLTAINEGTIDPLSIETTVNELTKQGNNTINTVRGGSYY